MAGGTGTRAYFSVVDRVGRFPELDGLRGVAVLLVLLRHAVRPIVEDHGTLYRIGEWEIATPLLNGWMGVDLFFVLSGFLITHHLLNRWPLIFDRSFMLRYLTKRLLRTFPAYAAAVAIAITGMVPYFVADSKDSVHSLTVHLLFLQDYLGSDLVAAFWSLGVEEKFYLICPLALLYLRRFSPRHQLMILGLLAVAPTLCRVGTVFSDHAEILNYSAFFWTVRSPFHLAMDGLWIGVICALLHADEGRRAVLRSWNFLLIGRASLAVLVGSLSFVAWFESEWYALSAVALGLIALAFGGLLLSSIFCVSSISLALRSAWLRAISTISYSVYLLHLMFVPVSLILVERLFPGSMSDPRLHFLAFTPIFFGLSIAAGLMLHFTIEKPFLIVKDKIRL